MKLRSLKPGSLCDNGAIIDYQGNPVFKGAAWVPINLGCRNRRVERVRGRIAFDFGWRRVLPIQDEYPGIPPTNRVYCVYRG